jgi:alpha/beta superfamily hydrolase
LTPRTTERRLIDGPAGALEIVLNTPHGALRGIALVAHPHPLKAGGGTLDNKVAHTLARTFFGLGYAAMRFNFRGAGRSEGTFDDGIGETDDALAALGWARQHLAEHEPRHAVPLPVVLAGFSFGAFVQTRVARKIAAGRMVLVGPAVNRFMVDAVPADTIVIHGEEDDVVPLADVLAWARPLELPIVVFPGCGHFFHRRLLQLQQVITGMWQPGHPVLPGT